MSANTNGPDELGDLLGALSGYLSKSEDVQGRDLIAAWEADRAALDAAAKARNSALNELVTDQAALEKALTKVALYEGRHPAQLTHDGREMSPRHRFTQDGICIRCGADAETDTGCVEELRAALERARALVAKWEAASEDPGPWPRRATLSECADELAAALALARLNAPESTEPASAAQNGAQHEGGTAMTPSAQPIDTTDILARPNEWARKHAQALGAVRALTAQLEAVTAEQDAARAEVARLKAALTALSKPVNELKYHLSKDGEFSICRTDKEDMGWGDTMVLGKIVEDIDAALRGDTAPATGRE